VHFLIKFYRNVSGATVVEYGLIVAAICLAISVVLFTMGDEIRDLFGDLADQISSSMADVET